MCEVAAHALLLLVGFERRPRRPGMRIAEGQVIVHEVADRLHPGPSGFDPAEQVPGDLSEAVRFAVAAAEQKAEQVVR